MSSLRTSCSRVRLRTPCSKLSVSDLLFTSNKPQQSN
ncbi:unnamed protein product [Brassica oleracea]